jgi:hypothetical protein
MSPNRDDDLKPSPTCGREDLAARLIYWDDLDEHDRHELEAHADHCPSCGPRLILLQQAQTLLERHLVSPSPSASGCPSAEDLYDYGRGPGHLELNHLRIQEIDAHVAGCSDCRALLSTLAVRPPAPLDARPARRIRVEGSRTRRLTFAFAAAAGIFGLVLAARQLLLGESASAREAVEVARDDRYVFPTAQTLRLNHSGPLLYPSGKVLAGRSASGEFQGLRFELLFEIDPQEDATEYRILLYHQNGDVWSPGEHFATLISDEPSKLLPATLAAAMEPGRYTWEAWCIANGLDTQLGRRDFEVVEDKLVLDTLERLREEPGPEGENAIIVLLNGTDFYTDLRAFARELPPTPERDQFLQYRSRF